MTDQCVTNLSVNALIGRSVDFDRVNWGPLTCRSSPVFAGCGRGTADRCCVPAVLRVWGTAYGTCPCTDDDAAAAPVTGCWP
jgi:hypothetical protein